MVPNDTAVCIRRWYALEHHILTLCLIDTVLFPWYLFLVKSPEESLHVFGLMLELKHVDLIEVAVENHQVAASLSLNLEVRVLLLTDHLHLALNQIELKIDFLIDVLEEERQGEFYLQVVHDPIHLVQPVDVLVKTEGFPANTELSPDIVDVKEW